MRDKPWGRWRSAAIVATILSIGALSYLLLAPVPIQAVAWAAPPSSGYVGPHQPNTLLRDLVLMDLRGDSGPEHVTAHEGKLYVAVESGRVLRMNFDGSAVEIWAQQPGSRVLGMAFDAKGRLVVADANRGLRAYSKGPDGKTIDTALVDRLTWRGSIDPVRFADAVVVAPAGAPNAGTIYFSDASRRFGAKDWGGSFEASVLDILEQSSTGRVIAYDPNTSTAHVVAHGLSFANGLALTPDGRHLVVAETGKYRVWKIEAAARELDVRTATDQAKVLLDNLPGYPDNIMPAPPAEDGTPRYWLGLAKPRSSMVDSMANKPWAREATLRLPRFLWPVPPAYGHVMRFDLNGRVSADFQDPAGAYPESTGATQVGDRLFIHSLHSKQLGALKSIHAVAQP